MELGLGFRRNGEAVRKVPTNYIGAKEAWLWESGGWLGDFCGWEVVSCGFGGGLPVGGKEIVDFVGGMGADFPEHVIEIGKGIVAMQFAAGH